MSKFKKSVAEVLEVQTALTALKESEEDNVEISMEVLNSLMDRLKKLEADIQKMRAKAEEKDEDKMLYGPGMVKKVLAHVEKYEEVIEATAACHAEISERFQPVEERRKAAVARATELQRQALARKKAAAEAEEARMRQQQKDREERWEKEDKEKRAKEEAEKSAMAAERRAYEEMMEKKKDAIAAAKRFDFPMTVKVMKRHCSDEEYQSTVNTLFNILKCLNHELSDPRFRHIRKSNPEIKRTIVDRLCGAECLHAVGFIEKELKSPTPDHYFVLPEPEVANVDGYIEQLDRVNAAFDYITGLKDLISR